MSVLIRESAANFHLVSDDPWRIAPKTEAVSGLPDGAWLYPLAVWKKEAKVIYARQQRFGLWLAPDTPVIALETLREDLANFSVIALDFPVFTDGRAYSLAGLLRARLGYQGELRAVGNVLRDQLLFTRRMGFDAWALDESAEEALAYLRNLSQSRMMRHPYQ
ncbi:MAG: DUF934 domain-containing protein [Zoogloeaceae bacterium]|jgi:uncharacterized protein (DUF934 family)|nr:DUF934 domain-containing protein [Zoogloeaceae bacterium]